MPSLPLVRDARGREVSRVMSPPIMRAENQPGAPCRPVVNGIRLPIPSANVSCHRTKISLRRAAADVKDALSRAKSPMPGGQGLELAGLVPQRAPVANIFGCNPTILTIFATYERFASAWGLLLSGWLSRRFWSDVLCLEKLQLDGHINKRGRWKPSDIPCC